jgi:protein-tyrosine phosphatase
VIDLHCHILSALDDGAAGVEESLEMCRLALRDGINTIVATPHHIPGLYSWEPDDVEERARLLRQRLAEAGIPLAILTGAELTLSPELPAMLRDEPRLALNGGSSFLVEFSPQVFPATVEPFLHSLMDNGLVPVIAHPERCQWYWRRPDFFDGLLGRGLLLQVSSGSVLGDFGTQARDFSLELFKRGRARILASDGHNSRERPPLLSPALNRIADLIGSGRAEALVSSTPASLLAEERIPPPTVEEFRLPEPPPRSWLRRFLGRLA